MEMLCSHGVGEKKLWGQDNTCWDEECGKDGNVSWWRWTQDCHSLVDN